MQGSMVSKQQSPFQAPTFKYFISAPTPSLYQLDDGGCLSSATYVTGLLPTSSLCYYPNNLIITGH